MSYILFHIPHTCLKIPSIFNKICFKDKDYINKSNILLSDYKVDQLLPKRCNKIKFKYSRIFCDVEKYKDDSKEEMSKYGMGVIYAKDMDGVITIPYKKYKEFVIKNYYDKYHNKLDKKVSTILKKYNKCLIIDFHSFSEKVVSKLFGFKDLPDICIGTNSFTSKELYVFTKKYFEERGYLVKENYPYSGTIIPNKYINKHKNISSIMLEINKKLYLNNDKGFYKLSRDIEEYYKYIKKSNII